MESYRTVSIPLPITSNDHSLLLATLKTASQAYNLLSAIAVQNTTTSKTTLNKLGYNKVRLVHPELPSAMVQSLRDTVVENLKSIHSNITRKNEELRTRKHKGKKQFKQYWSITPSKKETSSIRLDQRTFTLRGNQLTVSTVGKRVKTIIQIPVWFTKTYSGYAATNNASLSYNKQSKKFFLNLLFKKTIPDTINSARKEIVGLDRGLYTLAYLSTGEKFSSNLVRKKRRAQRYLRAKLQQKGTQSAKRHLKKLSGHEKRFMLDYNHNISKQILSNPNVSTIVLENLTGITEERKGRTLNTLLHQWNFKQLEELLYYKALPLGVSIVKIDPRYTSQVCNQCGVINKKNRKGNKYTCACGWVAHADLNAALNIRDLYKPVKFNSPSL